jgi:Leucine-rich repeat (LRR) protein
MKACLLIIFSCVTIFCSAQQTHFYKLKDALQQPENVRSLYVDADDLKNGLTVFDLQKFHNLNKLTLSDFDSNTDFNQLFRVLTGLSQIDTLELSNSGLSVLPDEIGGIKSLVSLKITYCHRLVSISNEIKYLKYLTHLNLTNNSISTLPNVFDSLKKLKILDLNSNKLNGLPESIRTLTALEELNLFHNQIVSLPESIGELDHLKSISLSDNPLIDLPANFNQLLLEELYIGKNSFEKFPYQLFDISTLKKISIYEIAMDSFPTSISKLKYLETISLNLDHDFDWKDAFLKISHNDKLNNLSIRGYRMAILPMEISLLKNLQDLNMDGFGNISEAVGYLSSMTNLTDLTLPYYQATSLPSSIGALVNLKVLKMEYCHLQTLPFTFSQLTSLEELYITKYRSESFILPDEIGRLVNLKIIDFTRCKIMCFPSIIRNLKQLQRIDLFGNSLTTIPDEFLEFKLLESLDLAGNQITSIPTSINQLNNLTELSLWKNKIKIVPAGIWNLNALEVLLLNENNIVEFEIPNSKLTTNQLSELSLSENIHLEILPEFIGELTNLKYLSLKCTQIKQLPVSLKQHSNLNRIVLSDNLIHNKSTLNKQYGDKIDFDGECESLKRFTVNYHDLYGKINTDIKTVGDSITLYYHYRYDYPSSIDEEYEENIFFTFNTTEVRSGMKFILPDSFVRISVLHLSIWDILMPELSFKYENLQGEITFMTIEKKKIETVINLYCPDIDNSIRTLIDNKKIIFKKK